MEVTSAEHLDVAAANFWIGRVVARVMMECLGMRSWTFTFKLSVPRVWLDGDERCQTEVDVHDECN